MRFGFLDDVRGATDRIGTEEITNLFAIRAQKIRQLRRATGLPQRESAEKLDITPTTFGAYERGDGAPDYKTKIMDKIRSEIGGESEVKNSYVIALSSARCIKLQGATARGSVPRGRTYRSGVLRQFRL